MMTDIALKPNLNFLSNEDKDKIHEAAIRILGEVGMEVLHDEALALLKKAGCSVENDGGVKIPGQLVQQAIESAPNNIPVYDRRGKPAMDLGGHRAYFGTGSDLIYALDSKKSSAINAYSMMWAQQHAWRMPCRILILLCPLPIHRIFRRSGRIS